MNVLVVDYGMGNLRSVSKALEHVAPRMRVTVTGVASEIDAADRVVFPGQGAMPDCMRHLDECGLRESVLRAARDKPLFGVCVGEQMLFDWSAEGATPGLAVMSGKVLRFPPDAMRGPDGSRLKVPHMGWNRVRPRRDCALFEGVEDGAHFYFVHSYAAPLGPWALAATDYGGEFCAAVRHANFHGVQFHPERSAQPGARVLANFLELG